MAFAKIRKGGSWLLDDENPDSVVCVIHSGNKQLA